MRPHIYARFGSCQEAETKARELRAAGFFAGVQSNPRAQPKIWEVYGPTKESARRWTTTEQKENHHDR